MILPAKLGDFTEIQRHETTYHKSIFQPAHLMFPRPIIPVDGTKENQYFTTQNGTEEVHCSNIFEQQRQD
jgi:hypothetical protein